MIKLTIFTFNCKDASETSLSSLNLLPIMTTLAITELLFPKQTLRKTTITDKISTFASTLSALSTMREMSVSSFHLNHLTNTPIITSNSINSPRANILSPSTSLKWPLRKNLPLASIRKHLLPLRKLMLMHSSKNISYHEPCSITTIRIASI